MGMTRWERKAALRDALRKKKRTAKQLAEELSVSETHFSRVLHGEREDRRVQVLIARTIGKPVDEVFEPEGASEPVSAAGGV